MKEIGKYVIGRRLGAVPSCAPVANPRAIIVPELLTLIIWYGALVEPTPILISYPSATTPLLPPSTVLNVMDRELVGEPEQSAVPYEKVV